MSKKSQDGQAVLIDAEAAARQAREDALASNEKARVAKFDAACEAFADEIARETAAGNVAYVTPDGHLRVDRIGQ